ncbi:MAG: hypothetical protein V1857_00855 [archaeon]
MMNGITSLRVTRETRNRLSEIGSKDETFDEIIQRLIEFYRGQQRESTLHELKIAAVIDGRGGGS